MVSSSTTSTLEPTWSAPINHLSYDMLQTATPNWSFMDSNFASSTPYHLSHQNAPYQYGSPWQPQHSAYAGPGGPSSSMYAAQLLSTQSMLPPSMPAEHDHKAYATTMPDVSPSTTSTSMNSSIVAGWAPLPPQHDQNSELPHVCSFRGCGRAYKRKAELDRHTQEKHGPTSGRLLCPVKMCPRGIPGEGFDRMSHLTQHLRSGKHKMTPQQAKFMAREHNPRKGGKHC